MPHHLPGVTCQIRDSGTILQMGRLATSSDVSVMRVGFERESRSIPVFEGESSIAMRLCERIWQYRQESEKSSVQSARRWRFEFETPLETSDPIRPGHVMVIAQEPYSEAWLQLAVFRKGFPHSSSGHRIPIVPKLERNENPIDWLEAHEEYDRWGSRSKLVAGISQPSGLSRDSPSNRRAGALILGVCPDVDGIVNEIWHSEGIQSLLNKTHENRIIVSGHLKSTQQLLPEVIDAASAVMGLSIQQALAGPLNSPEQWIGRPVWQLASLIYKNHLSSLDRAARRRSRGGADKQGASVGNPLVRYVQSFRVMPIEYYSCFISYSNSDLGFVERLYNDLQSRRLKCWFAPEDLKIGDPFTERIEESIRLHDKLLLVLSEASVKSPWVEREVAAAMERERRQDRLVLVPVRIDDAVMTSDRAWAAEIRRNRHIGDFRLWKDDAIYERSLSRLLRDLKTGRRAD